MTHTVRLFARGRELAGADAVPVELPAGATVADLRRALAERYPALAGLLAASAVAVNHDFAEDADVIAPADELAVIPPVSGG
ncbi:MAG: molybdopterin converting factor subunit 1 [Gemmataceae bacterium]|nr:molybdopterin converting factor subunit 1 [Gemmataceae bacterium]